MKRTTKLIILNIGLLGLIYLSIAFIDKPLSRLIANNLTSLKFFFYRLTLFFDQFSVYIMWLLSFCSFLGLILILSKKTKKFSFILLTLVFSHITASVTTNILKNEFKRARPEVYLMGKDNNVDFYNAGTKDYSFPSGHTSFYLSLFLPAAFAIRRHALFFLAIPVLIIIGRVVQNEHYLSDVLCSILIVFNFCLLSFWILDWLDNTLGKKRKSSS